MPPLPDKIEPATNQHHRGFFHSLTFGGVLIYALLKVYNNPNLDGFFKWLITSLFSGYLLGAITLPERGRWFVYVELTRQEDNQEDQVETWISVIVSRQPQTFERQASVYIPPPSSRSPLQFVLGVLLYAINFVLVGAVIVLFRRQASRFKA